jgi:hypothetical protein
MSMTTGSFSQPPVGFRVRIDVSGDLGVHVRFHTRGPVPAAGR